MTTCCHVGTGSRKLEVAQNTYPSHMQAEHGYTHDVASAATADLDVYVGLVVGNLRRRMEQIADMLVEEMSRSLKSGG